MERPNFWREYTDGTRDTMDVAETTFGDDALNIAAELRIEDPSTPLITLSVIDDYLQFCKFVKKPTWGTRPYVFDGFAYNGNVSPFFSRENVLNISGLMALVKECNGENYLLRSRMGISKSDSEYMLDRGITIVDWTNEQNFTDGIPFKRLEPTKWGHKGILLKDSTRVYYVSEAYASHYQDSDPDGGLSNTPPEFLYKPRA